MGAGAEPGNGMILGAAEGLSVGVREGTDDGAFVGRGARPGDVEGRLVGLSVTTGADAGFRVGLSEGVLVVRWVDATVDVAVGLTVGAEVVGSNNLISRTVTALKSAPRSKISLSSFPPTKTSLMTQMTLI